MRLAIQIGAIVMLLVTLVTIGMLVRAIIQREVAFWRIRREIKRTGVQFPVPDVTKKNRS